jgi:predicted lactoylglutathione lyase
VRRLLITSVPLLASDDMPTIDRLVFGTDDRPAAERFWPAAMPDGAPIEVFTSDAPTEGFRGFTLSLVAAQPGDVDVLVSAALDAGAALLKAPAKSLWGYGGAFRSPDGVVVTVASASKKRSGGARRIVDEYVLQLGVSDVAASKRFYQDHGFTVAKSFGGSYAELETGRLKLTLLKRAALAKTAGVAVDGSGSSRLQIVGDTRLVDPDGFEWVA